MIGKNSPNFLISSQNIMIKPLETFKYLTTNHVLKLLTQVKMQNYFFGLLHFWLKLQRGSKSSPINTKSPNLVTLLRLMRQRDLLSSPPSNPSLPLRPNYDASFKSIWR
jgi:hypothetical protein